MEFEIWDSETSNFIIGPYHPTYYGFDYYIGNGFAFIDENEETRQKQIFVLQRVLLIGSFFLYL